MKKRIVALLLTAMMAVGALAGCGSADKKEEKTDPAAENKLTVWCWDPSFNINAMNEAAKIYQKDHPDFELDVVEISSQDIVQNLQHLPRRETRMRFWRTLSCLTIPW